MNFTIIINSELRLFFLKKQYIYFQDRCVTAFVQDLLQNDDDKDSVDLDRMAPPSVAGEVFAARVNSPRGPRSTFNYDQFYPKDWLRDPEAEARHEVIFHFFNGLWIMENYLFLKNELILKKKFIILTAGSFASNRLLGQANPGFAVGPQAVHPLGVDFGLQPGFYAVGEIS